MAEGDLHSCLVGRDGGVWCRGNNAYGQLGNGSVAAVVSSAFTEVSGFTSGAQMVATGFYHSCALDSARGVWCWGYNQHGELGDGTATNRATPVRVYGLGADVQALAVGAYHSLRDH